MAERPFLTQDQMVHNEKLEGARLDHTTGNILVNGNRIMPIQLGIMNNVVLGPKRVVCQCVSERRGTGAYIPKASREYYRNYVKSVKGNWQQKQEPNLTETGHAEETKDESSNYLSLPKEWTY